MPYFSLVSYRNIQLPWSGENVLFVHIPKTGGTSMEMYLKKRARNKMSLFSDFGYLNGVSAQHLTLSTIYQEMENKNEAFPQASKISKIITIIRNPYTRLMSELFHIKRIQSDTTPDEVTQIIKHVFHIYQNDNTIYDGHLRPQYQYLINPNTNELYPNIIIVHQETLNEDMRKLGFIDFSEHSNIGAHRQASSKESSQQHTYHETDYQELLNDESIRLINDFYDKDFELFHYNKK